MSEEELRKLDELAQRMGRTRSDVIRDLISRFDEALKQEVERERKRWITMGFVAALELAILDPEVILRFVRKNVDILGFPDFLIGMTKVRNRVALFSHQDRIGSQLLNLVRARIEEDIKREEAELMREEGEDEEDNVGRAAQVRISANRPARPNTVHAIPVTAKYKLVTTNRANPPIARSTAIGVVGKPVNSNEGGGGKSTASTTVPGSKKSASEKLAAGAGSPSTQSTSSTPRVSANDNSKDVPSPVGRVSTGKPAGDFVFALVANLYHKHRDGLLKLIEGVAGD